MNFCQSCGMPLMSKEMLGTEKDGSISEDFCEYCYKNGEFTSEITMDEMIDFCVPKVVENTELDEKQARQMMKEMFPTLKRWK